MKPTESELEILNVLWTKGPSTVRDVHEAIEKAGYTTTLKLMQIMLEKGMLQRNETNRSHIYHAKINQEKTQGHLLQKMIDNVFNGSATQLVMQALGHKNTSQEELEQIKNYLQQIDDKNQESNS